MHTHAIVASTQLLAELETRRGKSGRPVRLLEAIAASVGEDAQTLEDVVEPYLLQVGFLARTRQGRRLTDAAFLHLGIDPPAGPAELFE